MDKIRTRFAPSPTGYMHIGNLRTALYAYLLAKHSGGDFVLRIEDTDQERYVEGAVDLIYRTMAETGLKHDEGPDLGGEYGPYIQSDRRGIYKEYAEKLVELGGAYYCFCDKERLEALKEAQSAAGISPKYDGFCRSLTKEEIAEKIAAGVPYVIRQKIDQRGTTTFKDEVFGSITVENSTLDDNVLLKSDGLPTYNFANVVDDHLMCITHIIRGSEYLSSTPKYNLLYHSFGWEIPTYIHVSPVMKESGKKLSKREGDASYEDFINKGYLKDAIINYIALLGWSPGGENEIFTLDELVKEFSVSGISKSPAIFDEKKLAWLNGEYIRKLTAEEFLEYAKPFYEKAYKREDIDALFLSGLLHDRTEKFSDIPEQIDFIDALPDYDIDLYNHKKMKTNPENSLESLKAMLPVLEGISEWNLENIHDALFAHIAEREVKNGLVLWPLRVAVSGKAFTPGGGPDLAALLGKEDTIARVKAGIAKLEQAL
ncbi:MAG: glutamate--tRNA ligase [Ruminococcaceae bacterium]|nr:glutamate--tRNA ligase [Oscillospiraceae bacterium]